MPALPHAGWPALALLACVAGCDVYNASLLGAAGSGEGGTAAGMGAAAGSGNGGAVGGAGAQAGTDTGGGGSGTAGSGGDGGSMVEDSPPYVQGSTPFPPITVDLSLEGFRDWAHWGLAGADDYNHREGPDSQLLDFRPWGSDAAQHKLGGAVTFEWSDGVPTQQATTTNGIWWQGVDQGFVLVAPATEEDRHLKLYMGVLAGTAEILASHSDPAATSGVETHVSGEVDEWNLRVFSVDYGHAEPGSELTISVRLISALDAMAGVAVHGVTFSAP